MNKIPIIEVSKKYYVDGVGWFYTLILDSIYESIELKSGDKLYKKDSSFIEIRYIDNNILNSNNPINISITDEHSLNVGDALTTFPVCIIMSKENLDCYCPLISIDYCNNLFLENIYLKKEIAKLTICLQIEKKKLKAK